MAASTSSAVMQVPATTATTALRLRETQSASRARAGVDAAAGASDSRAKIEVRIDMGTLLLLMSLRPDCRTDVSATVRAPAPPRRAAVHAHAEAVLPVVAPRALPAAGRALVDQERHVVVAEDGGRPTLVGPDLLPARLVPPAGVVLA